MVQHTRTTAPHSHCTPCRRHYNLVRFHPLHIHVNPHQVCGCWGLAISIWHCHVRLLTAMLPLRSAHTHPHTHACMHAHVQVVWFNRSSQIPGTLLEPFFKEGDW